jgi:hypothetical protein
MVVLVGLQILCAALSVWFSHKIEPDPYGGDKLTEADRFAAAGKLAEAARLYGELARNLWRQKIADMAVYRLRTLVEEPPVQAPASELAGVLREAVRLQRGGRWPDQAEVLYRRCRALVDQYRSTDPDGALAILESIAPLAPSGQDLESERHSLVEALVAAQPDDLERASQLAASWYAQGKEARAIALLEPLRARLGATDGALILALADARQGRMDRALALVRPYTHARLEASHAGERSRRRSSFVTAALELATILLKHSHLAADRETRESELNQAEKLFLAVSNLSRGNDDPRLRLAEVYYWEGKQLDGRALLDQVLTERKRAPWLLVEISELLRRVGSLREARALAEEAYQTGPTPEFRQHTAVTRSLMGVDLDDRILWIRRGDPADPEVRAFLNWDLADQAIEHGDDAKAVEHLREAIALYDAMDQQPATLSNSATLLLRLAKLTGDHSAFDRGFANVEKAHKLEPANTLTMMNLIFWERERALRDIIGPSIDFDLLKEDAQLEHLAFLYHDRAGRKDCAARLRAHAGINRLIELFERDLLLAPRNGILYAALDELYASAGETEKQRDLQRRLEHIDLDQAEESTAAKDVDAGALEDQRRTAAAGTIARAESTLKAVRARKRDLTIAAAAANLARARLRGYCAGLDADADAILALAEEAFAASPSYGTRNLLVSALLIRAGRRLAQSQPAYARMVAKAGPATGHDLLIGIALNGENPLRDEARQDSDVRAAVNLIQGAYRDDPEYWACPWAWSLLHALYPAEAAKMAETYFANESAQFSRAVERQVKPRFVTTALSAFWAAEMVGKNADGPAILKAYAAQGVPLPFEPP